MKKVIAFVSVFSALATNNYEYYDNEEKKTVSGMLTNEAPIKCLLEKYPDIDEIICLISKGAQDPPKWDAEKSPGNFRVKTEEEMKEKTGGLSPYQYLEKKIREFLKEKEVVFTPIDYDEKGDNYFAKKIIPKILENVHGDDIIFLETTGGFRINITQMMLLTHILNYQGTELACAVYSDFQKKRIFDVTDSYRDFDLVNGLNEFVSTGATGMFESHFKEDETAKQLIEAMKRLTEAIILARITLIEKRKSEVEQLLEKADQELQAEENADKSILTVLLPIFRTKYSQISTIPELIKWCASNNLIQTAFTLYKDWIPEYLMKDTGIITLTDIIPQKYNNRGKPIIPNLYCCIFDNEYVERQASLIISEDKDHYVKLIKNIKDLMLDNADRIKYKNEVTYLDMVKLLRNYSYAALIRNELNHAIVSSDDIPFIKSRRRYLSKLKNKDGSQKYIFDEDKLDIAYLKKFLISSMDQIIELASR